MKTTIRLILIVLMVALSATTTEARGRRQGDDNRQQRREQLAQTQANYIAQELKLDEATTAKFVTTYCAYQREVWQLGRGKRHRENMTNAEAQQAISERFDRNQRILDLRRKYQTEYSTFLTPQQILRVYELEDQLMQQLRQRRHSR